MSEGSDDSGTNVGSAANATDIFLRSFDLAGMDPDLQAPLREYYSGRSKRPEELKEFYDEIAVDYEKIADLTHLYASDIAADLVNKYSHLLPKHPRIMDAFAGTGLAGEKLKNKYGFSDIDGFDGCTKMLEQAERKNVYKHLTHFVVEDGKRFPFDDSVYDAVVLSASMFRASDFPELIRMTKPGGVIVNVFPYKMLAMKMIQSPLPVCHQLAEEGKWRCLVEEVSEKQYDVTSLAFIQVYQVL